MPTSPPQRVAGELEAEAVAYWMAAQVPEELRIESDDPWEIVQHAKEESIRRHAARIEQERADHNSDKPGNSAPGIER